MVPIVFSFKWGNLLVISVKEYHFPCVGNYLDLATWNKVFLFVLVWHMRRPMIVLQGRGSWTSRWIYSSSVFYNSFCSNGGAWYGRSRSTLNSGCKPKHEGMLRWKSIFSNMLKDVVRTISQRIHLSEWTSEAFLLDMKPDLIPNLKWMRNMMLIMSVLRFRINSLEHFMFLFMDVVDLVSKL